MNERITKLKEWGLRIDSFRDELKFLLSSRWGFPPATFAVQAAIHHLEHASKVLYNEVLVVIPGSQIVFLADSTLPGEDSLQVVDSIDADGVIQYRSGLADTMQALREALVAGVAELKPTISGSEPPEPGKAGN